MATRVAITAKTREGAVLFEGTVDPVGTGAGGPSDRAAFDAPPGRVQLDMSVLGETGQQLDTDVRDVEVPDLKPRGTLLLPPIVLATRSAREFREATAEIEASPDPSREFRRTERLVIRVPALAGSSDPPRVEAQLLNRGGQKLWDLPPVPAPEGAGVTQFDLPLAPLAPGDYIIHITATTPSGATEQRVSFRVTG
jgi:hypothetical protein